MNTRKPSPASRLNRAERRARRYGTMPRHPSDTPGSHPSSVVRGRLALGRHLPNNKGGCHPDEAPSEARNEARDEARQELRNVALCVMEATEVVRPWNGRGRPPTYAQRVDAIAGAARQLAEMVLATMEGEA